MKSISKEQKNYEKNIALPTEENNELIKTKFKNAWKRENLKESKAKC